MKREPPLRFLIVEDEVLLALELEQILGDAGHTLIGHAMDSDEARDLAEGAVADVALVDVHLLDGPTGIEVARGLRRRGVTVVLFMTANAKRLPEDYAGAAGVIAKPYTSHAFAAVLAYIAGLLPVVPNTQTPGPPPRGIVFAAAFARERGIALAA